MKRVKFWAALLAAACILLRPEAAVNGAQAAMRQWASAVAPALFPFLALLPALTGPEACAAYEAAFGRIMRPLLGLPGSAAPAVIIGMISGSPGGALALRRIAAQTGMPAAQSARVALAVSGVSPAYLILGVGTGIFGDSRLGLRLAGMQIAVQLILLLMLRPLCRNIRGEIPQPPLLHREKPIARAVETVLGVCGYMVFFSAITSALTSYIGEAAGKYLLAAADLPSGLPALAQVPALMGAAIGFGGLCIAAQNLDALEGVGVRPGQYLCVRVLAAAMMAALCGLTHPGIAQAAPRMHTRTAYALSLLAAAAALIPALIFISGKLFLNKRKFPSTSVKKG